MVDRTARFEPHVLAFSLRRKCCGRFGGSDTPPACHSLPPHPPGYSPFGPITRRSYGSKFCFGKKTKKKATLSDCFLLCLVAGVGLEPHDLRVMSPTSYQLLYPAIYTLSRVLRYNTTSAAICQGFFCRFLILVKKRYETSQKHGENPHCKPCLTKSSGKCFCFLQESAII